MLYLYNIYKFYKFFVQVYIYIYDIHVVLRFFDLRYKVSLTWDSNPRPSDDLAQSISTHLHEK